MCSGQAFTQRPQPLQRSGSIFGFPFAKTTLLYKKISRKYLCLVHLTGKHPEGLQEISIIHRKEMEEHKIGSY